MTIMNAVSGLTTLLGGIRVGVQQFQVFPGPLGNTQAVAMALGDMTKIPADAYVVPHFNGGISLGGVGAAVARAGAMPGLRSYERFLDSLPRSGDRGAAQQNWGDVKVTESGGGLSTYLLNAVSVGSPDVNTEARTISLSIFNGLNEAQRLQLNSVVSPALGTGIIGKLSDSLSAYAILSAVNAFMRGASIPMMVTIAIYGDARAYDAWVRMLEIGPDTNQARTIAIQSGERKFDIDRWKEGMELMVGTVNWADGHPDGNKVIH